ncbi:MAG TPA: hypothetical protein VIG86_07215 [Candidatus Dormibacteraeota bacterium]
MRTPRGGKKPTERKPARPGKKASTRAGRPPSRALVPPDLEGGFGQVLRPFRGPPESSAGLRHELIDLRAEVHRLAAEIDKLWARERGRGAATPGRTARSIAGKPVRTGTRAARPSARGGATGNRTGTGPKRAAGTPRPAGAKRGTGWAKPKSKSRRAGTTPRRKGR